MQLIPLLPTANTRLNPIYQDEGGATQILAQACCVPFGWRSGGQLATTLVATINIIFVFHFFHSLLLRPFFVEGVLGSKNLFSEN